MSAMLNPAQRNAVGSALRVVAGALERAKAALDARPGIVTVPDGQLAAAERQAMREGLAVVGEELAALAAELGFAPWVVNVRAKLAGQLAAAADTLEDVRPRRLGAYGAVIPEAAHFLEPRLVQLIAQLDALRGLTRAAAAAATAPPAAGSPKGEDR